MSEGLIRRWTPSNLVSFGKEPNRKSCMGLRKSWISITWTSGKWSLYLKTKGVLGALGIINTKLTNDCLLVKWIWKIMHGTKGNVVSNSRS